MSDKIRILNGKQEGYTAKEAMRHVVEYVKARSAHAIEIVVLEDSKDVGAESALFVKMFMRFLHKNSGSVFLLAQNEEMLAMLSEHIEENYPGIHMTEMANWEEHAASHDMILNRINGAEAEYIIAALSSNEQEEFLEEYRAALDAKFWLGLGTHLKRKESKFSLTKFRDFFVRQFSKKEV